MCQIVSESIITAGRRLDNGCSQYLIYNWWWYFQALTSLIIYLKINIHWSYCLFSDVYRGYSASEDFLLGLNEDIALLQGFLVDLLD